MSDMIADWNPGDVILDLYEVKELLGEGGMGKVHRVHHKQWNVDLAVKSPRPDVLRKKNAESIEPVFAGVASAGQFRDLFHDGPTRFRLLMLVEKMLFILRGEWGVPG